MAVTIKDISEKSGVSRGTVDRVLNGRGKVSADKAALVRKVAAQLGYRPNLAGKALAVRKKSYTVGVLLISEGIPFFDEVTSGVCRAQRELAEYGVSVRRQSLRGYDPAAQVAAMEHLCQKGEAGGAANVLILNPIDDPAVVAKISELAEAGTAVITVNTDVEGSRRLCYVGSEYEKSGAAAAGMLGLLLPAGAQVGVLTGSARIWGHSRRVTGFRRVLREKYPDFTVVKVEETLDDDEVAYQAAQRILLEHPDLRGLFIAAAGTAGACRAVQERGLAGTVKIVSVDAVPETAELLRRGVIQATICQQPFQQGYQAVRRAFSYLVSGETPGDFIVKDEIKIAETLDA